MLQFIAAQPVARNSKSLNVAGTVRVEKLVKLIVSHNALLLVILYKDIVFSGVRGVVPIFIRAWIVVGTETCSSHVMIQVGRGGGSSDTGE